MSGPRLNIDGYIFSDFVDLRLEKQRKETEKKCFGLNEAQSILIKSFVTNVEANNSTAENNRQEANAKSERR